MRTVSADNNAILRGSRRFRARILVKDSGGTFRDLTTYAGVNLVKSAKWGEAVDDPGIAWTVTLARERGLLSLAPLMQTSGLNRNFDIATAYSPLLKVGRAMRLEWALQAEEDPSAPSWQLATTGYIDTIDFDGDELELGGRGEQAKLVDAYIERERVYAFAQGSNADRGCYIFEPSRAYVVGDRVVPTSAKQNLHFYRCTTAGTAAATEPSWPTGGGSTVTSGSAVFTESGATSDTVGTPVETVMQQLLNDTLGAGAVTLNTPVSPSWNVKWFLVSRQILWDELRLLADQIGWSLRHKFDAGSGSMKLTLYDPNRTNTTSARTFFIPEVDKIRRAQVQIFDIRNVVQVVFSDSQDLDPNGYPRRKTVQASNSSSITAYGRRFCEISESSASNIDTSAEATTLANAVLDDLREPEVDFEAEVPLFPFVELTDLYTLAANGVHFDADQKLAVVSYEHNHDAKESTTTIRVRGRPSSAKSIWLQRCSDSKDGEVHALTDLQYTAPILDVDTKPVGGARVQLSLTRSKRVTDLAHEVHVSTSSGFTPDDSTLAQVMTGTNEVELGNLDPAKLHYYKLVPISLNALRPVRGEPSEEVSFTPGRGQATHLDPNVVWGRLPLNGGFETQLDPAEPPDFWFLPPGEGAFGTEVTLGTSSGLGGARYAILKTVDTITRAALFSAEFSVDELTYYAASVWRKCVSGSGNNFTLLFDWFDIAHAPISSAAGAESVALTDAVGSWVETRTAAILPPSGARFARLRVELSSGVSGREVHVDSVSFDVEERWHVVGASGEIAFSNSWVANGSPFVAPRFKRDQFGWVTINGIAKNGTVGSVLFTLPVGYRPDATEYFVQDNNGAVGAISISTAGVVTHIGASNAYLSINCRFRAV